MDTNNIGRISMKTGAHPRAKFNLSHDVFTSAGFGECQPVFFAPCDPNTKSVISHDVLIRLAPMLAPTRTRVGLRLISKFVSMSDLTENFAFLMADKPVSRADKTFVPKALPCMSLAKLSCLCLIGASMTYYSASGSNADSEDYQTLHRWKIKDDYTSLPSGFIGLAKILCDKTTIDATALDDNILFTNSPTAAAYSPFNVASSRGFLNVYRAIGLDQGTHGALWLPIAADKFAHLFEGKDTGGYAVSLDGADFVIPLRYANSNNQGYTASLAIKLSAFGERIRKALLGVGYEIDFFDNRNVSLMPLFALFKAWYDSYAPQLYDNWTSTALYKILFAYEKDNIYDWGMQLRTNPNSTYEHLIKFVVDLGNMWYSEEQDVVTAHIRTLSVSNDVVASGIPQATMPNVPTTGGHFTDNANTDTEPPTTGPATGHAYIQSASFSQLDLEILKKAYQVVNRNTIAGQRIAEILRANGLGKYVDECKSHFIGETYVRIDVNDVNATGDSFNNATGQGSTLGSYVGKGVGYDESKTFTFENDEYGYLITLACIVPDSGLCQQEAPWVNSVRREDFYLGDYDGKGFEANSKKLLCAQQDWFDYNEKQALQVTFGFAPRMSRHKMAIGRANGNFSLRSNRDLPLAYTLDKFMDIGNRHVEDAGDASDFHSYGVTKMFRPSMLPCATPNLRFVGRDKWLNNPDRIFNLEGKVSPWSYNALNLAEGTPTDGHFVWLGYMMRTYDNFLLFVNNNFVQYAGKLPFEDSFETREDGNKGVTDVSIGKA